MKARVGLTGGIGCGKTLIAQVFEHLGVAVFYSDTQAKLLYDDEAFLEKIAEHFGRDIIENGSLNRRKLADKVFSDKKELQILNSMVHPEVFKRFDEWAEKQHSPYVIMESAILFENSLQDCFDTIISISTPEELVLQRVMLRDDCNKEQVLQRIRSQMPQEEKNALADYVILHDNMTMLLPQILSIHDDILKHCIKNEKRKN